MTTLKNKDFLATPQVKFLTISGYQIGKLLLRRAETKGEMSALIDGIGYL